MNDGPEIRRPVPYRTPKEADPNSTDPFIGDYEG